VIIDRGFEHHRPEVLLVGLKRLQVALGDLGGLGEDRRAPLHIQETHRPPKVEGQLLRIEQMKNHRVVLAEPQMLEARTEQFGLDEEIRNDHHERALGDRFGQFVQHADKLGLALGPGGLEHVEKGREVRRIAPRRNAAHDPARHA
jgi:hypothetical protein